jgi:carbon storage regulator
MLLITRRIGEGLVINGTITVQVLAVQGGRVKLGVEYPAGNSVFRQELFTKIRAENQAATLPIQPDATTADTMRQLTGQAVPQPAQKPASKPAPKPLGKA